MNDDPVMDQPTTAFRPGDRVQHPRRGAGIVLRCLSDGRVAVRFDDSTQTEVLFPFMLQRLHQSSGQLCSLPH